MSAPKKVRVPQADGTVVLTPGGDPAEQRTFQVDDHLVSPRNKDEQEQLLLLVEGARLATAKELSAQGGTEQPAGSTSGNGTKE